MRWRRSCSSTKELSSEDLLGTPQGGSGGERPDGTLREAPAAQGTAQEGAPPLSEGTLAVLQRMGIRACTRHQAIAIEAAMQGAARGGFHPHSQRQVPVLQHTCPWKPTRAAGRPAHCTCSLPKR